MTRSCAVNADAVPSSERSAKMAAMRGGPGAEGICDVVRRQGVRRLLSLPGRGVGGR